MVRLTIKDVTYHIEQWHEEKEQTIVMLHGFTGSTKTWQPIAAQLHDYHIIAIDCIGHGQTDAPMDVAPYAMGAQVDALHAIFETLSLSSFLLVGYSMGGRIALSYAARYPERVAHLLLESASPGLEETEARAARRESDAILANKIEANGLQSFVNAWENIPLFASQKQLPRVTQAEIRAERLAQREIGLANSLRGMGTGSMPSLWQSLSSLPMPVTLVTGTLDEKFVLLNEKMQKMLRNAKHILIPEVGHAIHVENPQKFATIVKETISTIH